MNPSELTVAEAVRRIAEGTLSATTLVESCLERVDSTDKSLQAWVTVDWEGALDAARRVDNGLRSASGPAKLLSGVPIGVKDIFRVAGLPATAGSPIYRDFIPTTDATSVARLREAGVIILGKTVTTEFAFTDPARTRNPWDLSATPGGSSSGSAAGVASRMIPAALGSQTAGSTLRPAAYCGIVGLKPTYGRVSRAGVFPLAWTLDTVGILARTVEDAALLLQAMAGPDPRDPLSARDPVPAYLEEMESHAGHPPTIGLVHDFFDRGSREVVDHATAVLDLLRGAGATVREVALPDALDRAIDAQQTVMAAEAAAVHQETFTANARDYGPNIRALVERGAHILGVDYLQAQRYRRRFHDRVEALFSQCDVVLTPATPTPAPRDLTTTGDPSFQTPWTFAGVPALVIPTGQSKEGLPLGVQIISRSFAEGLLLGVGKWCEGTLGVSLGTPTAA